MDRIIFCVFLENDYGIYNRKMSDYFPPGTECFYVPFRNSYADQSLLFYINTDVNLALKGS